MKLQWLPVQAAIFLAFKHQPFPQQSEMVTCGVQWKDKPQGIASFDHFFPRPTTKQEFFFLDGYGHKRTWPKRASFHWGAHHVDQVQSLDLLSANLEIVLMPQALRSGANVYLPPRWVGKGTFTSVYDMYGIFLVLW